MVILGTLNFPKSSTNISCLIGTVNVPYNGTDGISKCCNITCPVGFQLKFTNYQAQAQTISFTHTKPTVCNVYKNGTLLETTTLNSTAAYDGFSVNTKSFNMASSSSQIGFEVNDYIMNISIQYYPKLNSTVGSTDIYTFYAIMNYFITSTLSQLYYVGNNPFVIGWIIDTTINPSYLSNFSYPSGSSDTSGYISYNQTQQLISTNSWDGTIANAYYPKTNYSLWSGIYQLMALYSREIWISEKNLNFKQQITTGSLSAQTQYINWYSADSSSAIISQIYASTTTNNLNFVVSPTLAGNGFNFSGGSVRLGNGYIGKQGANGTSTTGNNMNTWWTGSTLQAWVDTTNVGTFTLCDYRVKENIQPCSDVLEKLCNLKMFNYELKDIGIFKKNGVHIGYFAHELKEAFPELNNVVSGEKDSVDENGNIQPQTIQPEFCNILMRAIQELKQEVIDLQNEFKINPKYQPIGTIIIHVTLTLGLPYLLCNGQAVSRVIFASLFDVIGINYGKGDETTTFNVPNYSGMFLKHQKLGMNYYILATN